MSEDHDSIVIARLRDTAENIHSRGPVIAAQHLRDAADRIAGQRQQIEALEAANASLATDADDARLAEWARRFARQVESLEAALTGADALGK